MKILLINKFFYVKGGAERVFFETARLLKEKGHELMFFSMAHPLNMPTPYSKYFVRNVDYENMDLRGRLMAAINIIHSSEAARKIARLIKDERPDVAHLHNIYHQISPSILYPLKRAGIPIVMSLHDHKMVCASYLMFNKGKVCQACKDERYYRCFLKKCVKDSRMKSLLAAVEMYTHHKIRNVYDKVDFFISPSAYLKSKLTEMGFKGEVRYLPHFVDTISCSPRFDREEDSIVYFGRLSPEKGLDTLLDSVKDVKGIVLKIIGTGPMQGKLEDRVKNENLKNVRLLGYKGGSELNAEIKKSMAVVLPSECCESFGLTVAEAFALGKPAIGSRIGGIAELIEDGVTGWTFEPANVADLSDKILLMMSHAEKLSEMGKAARDFVERKLSPEAHYNGLMDIYQKAMERHR